MLLRPLLQLGTSRAAYRGNILVKRNCCENSSADIVQTQCKKASRWQVVQAVAVQKCTAHLAASPCNTSGYEFRFDLHRVPVRPSTVHTYCDYNTTPPKRNPWPTTVSFPPNKAVIATASLARYRTCWRGSSWPAWGRCWGPFEGRLLVTCRLFPVCRQTP